MSVVTLLVVADTTWTDHLRQTLFAREGMRIVSAVSVAEAQQKARFAPPDLVLISRDLPDASGDELCRWFRSNIDVKKARLVVMLPDDSGINAQFAREAGADQVIVRPSTPEMLTPLVAQLLEAPLRREIRVPVEIRFEGESASGTLHGLTRNLSPGGAMLEVSGAAETETGDNLYVRMHPPGVTGAIVAKAEIMRIVDQQIAKTLGIRFLKFEKDGQDRLVKFIEQQQL